MIIAIDVSDSTMASSGRDLDGDGPDGRTDPALWRDIVARAPEAVLVRPLEGLDLDDSVLFAELAAAAALVERVDPRSLRIGIVVFSDRAHVAAPLGSRREQLRAVLDSLRRGGFWSELKGTNFAEAIHTSLAELRPPPDPVDPKAKPKPKEAPPPRASAPAREASILLLSDGAPTRPVHAERAQQYSVEAAQDAAVEGVRVYPFALGSEAEPALEIYQALATTTGGRFERIDRPGDAVARLRVVDLADLASIAVENLTSGQAGRAVRVFPDGAFDAFLPLEAGPNRVRVTAVAVDGARSALERTVVYRPGAPDDPDRGSLAAQQRALLDELRRRTREVELWAEIERGRSFQTRELELDVQRPAVGADVPEAAPQPPPE
ncbi:MAG TPA: hypothetical protein VNE71_15935 [Myxococcota bacterium]|nr:hypothetical protein [Myxococcota bacterium]